MKTQHAILALGLTLAISAPAFAVSVVDKADVKFNVGGYFQELATIQNVNDPGPRSNTRFYLFNKQTRLNMGGEVSGVKFFTEVAYGAEETAKPQWGGTTSVRKGDNTGATSISTPLNTNLSLMDFYADLPFINGTTVRVGQFQPILNREALVRPTQTVYATKSMQNMGFDWGQDVGFTMFGKADTLEYAVGIMTGGGANVPERYIPERMGTPMMTLKVGMNNGLDQDIMTPRPADAAPVKEMKSAYYLHGFWIRDSFVGHGTALSVKFSQRSLILNTLYNTLMVNNNNATLYELGVDGAMQMPYGDGQLSARFEANHTTYTGDSGSVTLYGGMVEVDLVQKPFVYALRISALAPKGMAITDQKIYEIAPAVSWQINPNTKLVMDMPIIINAPVKYEDNVGTYEMTTCWNSVSPSTARTGAGYLRVMGQFSF